jgi:hypothetical protein
MSSLATANSAMMIESSALQVYLRPEVGGKITQIVDLRSEQPILVPPSKPYTTIPPGACWLDYDLSGMDDCFPNIAPGSYPGSRWAETPLPDHGEWVYGAWKVEAATGKAIRLQRAGIALPYSARKTVQLIHDDTIRIDYEVENLGDVSLRYLWAAHPLILVNELGYRLTLPKGTKQARILMDRLPFEWPLFKGIDLSSTWIPDGPPLKLFILDLTEGWCDLGLSHCTLRFEFDLATNPKLGIWLNNFGFPLPPQKSIRCIAIEPCTSASDKLDDLDADTYPMIPPRSTTTWALTLKVGSPQ